MYNIGNKCIYYTGELFYNHPSTVLEGWSSYLSAKNFVQYFRRLVFNVAFNVDLVNLYIYH